MIITDKETTVFISYEYYGIATRMTVDWKKYSTTVTSKQNYIYAFYLRKNVSTPKNYMQEIIKVSNGFSGKPRNHENGCFW